jgi:hypothetical protein
VAEEAAAEELARRRQHVVGEMNEFGLEAKHAVNRLRTARSFAQSEGLNSTAPGKRKAAKT